jgi:hypothetical protein
LSLQKFYLSRSCLSAINPLSSEFSKRPLLQSPEACIRSLAIPLRRPGAAMRPFLVVPIHSHHGQPPFPKVPCHIHHPKATSHATHAIKERRHQITAD